MKNKILLGDCLKLMKLLKPNSIDTIITDPPYGLSFMSKKWDYNIPSIDIWKECLRVLKPGGTALIFAGSRTQHRMTCNVEDAGFVIKDCIMWLYSSGFPKGADISKQLDKGKERKIIGYYNQYIDGGIRKKTNCGQFTVPSTVIRRQRNLHNGMLPITEPTTPEAKLWNGWKSHALKPAYEPIILAMKPNEGSYAQNALKYGVSGLWINGGRIPIQEKDINLRLNAKNHNRTRPKTKNVYGPYNKTIELVTQDMGYHNTKGRYPSNIILDEEAAKMLDEQTGQNTSRFFYCAKASPKERKNNNHPTVKPIKLMEYLCKLTKTPTGGIVLDLFAGSGTTGIACQNTGRNYILIEQSKEYWEIAKRRIRTNGIKK
ncbi:site-specific DNA-methyltransferase [Candidatus Pacearchaeota archaeon]|nr:site-specific DNA-methyltransferase [Candidatus Pacearchaeota archaeon]